MKAMWFFEWKQCDGQFGDHLFAIIGFCWRRGEIIFLASWFSYFPMYFFTHQSCRTSWWPCTHSRLIVWINHRTSGSSKTASATTQIFANTFPHYVSTGIQYPRLYSSIHIRDKSLQGMRTIHHRYSCHTCVVLDSHSFAAKFTTWCSFDVTSPQYSVWGMTLRFCCFSLTWYSTVKSNSTKFENVSFFPQLN